MSCLSFWLQSSLDDQLWPWKGHSNAPTWHQGQWALLLLLKYFICKAATSPFPRGAGEPVPRTRGFLRWWECGAEQTSFSLACFQVGSWLKLHSSLEMESAYFSRLPTIVPCTVVGEKFDNENDVPKWYFLKENIMSFPITAGDFFQDTELSSGLVPWGKISIWM